MDSKSKKKKKIAWSEWDEIGGRKCWEISSLLFLGKGISEG